MQLAFWQKLCQKELQATTGPCSLQFTREHQIQQLVRKVENVGLVWFAVTGLEAMLTPSLVGRQCWGKTILPGAGYGLGTYRTVDIFNFSHFSCPILEKLRFLCFYIIKSVPRKGQNTPKSDFRGPKIPPRGASST